MPHLTIQYTGNLDDDVDISRLCETVHQTMVGTGLFEVGAIRVRAVRCADYAVADRLPRNAFVDMVLRIGFGRSEEDKKRAGSIVFEAVARQLAPQLEQPHFALSLEICEIDPELSWKKNAMHQRLRSE